MTKKVISLLLCLTLCIPMVCMADGAQPETAVTATEKKVYTLSLEDAIEMALENNDQLAVCDYQKESYKYGLEAAKITKRNNKDAVMYASGGYELGYVQDGYYVDLYETQIKLADLNKEKTKAAIAYSVFDAYYGYKNTFILFDLAADYLLMAEENMAKVNSLSALGMISDVEVKNAQLSVDSAKNAMESLKRQFETMKEMFKNTLNIDEDCDFVLTSEIETPEFSADLAADTETAMSTIYDVLSLKENLRLAEVHLKLTEKYATKNTSAYYSDLSSYIQTKYTVENTLEQIELQIKSAYDSVLTAKDELDIAQRNVEIQKTLYEAATLKFDMGMITNIELTQTLLDYDQAKIDLESAKYSYLLAVEKYKQTVTVGL